MPETLRGKQIVLAGGSGGLGSATAELLAGEGAELIVSYRANAARALGVLRAKAAVPALKEAGVNRDALLAGECNHLLCCFAVRADIDALIRYTMFIQECLGHPAVLTLLG